jgi:hypothetical protein
MTVRDTMSRRRPFVAETKSAPMLIRSYVPILSTRTTFNQIRALGEMNSGHQYRDMTPCDSSPEQHAFRAFQDDELEKASIAMIQQN